jgi:hypothetical protein
MNMMTPPDAMRAAPASLSTHWSAMQDAGAAVALLAGVDSEGPSAAARAFPAQIRDAGGWRLELASSGMTDLAAILEPGLAALLAARARGHDARAPARMLWDEFCAARDALIALAPQAGAMGPRRSA